MHGTGLFTSFTALGGGGSVVTLRSRSLDPEELWSTVEGRRVQALSIVGDAFQSRCSAPLRRIQAAADLRSCVLIVSSGVMWSPEVKRGLLEQLPHAILFDSFGSSEATGFGAEVTKDSETKVGKFRLGPNCKVFAADGREVRPGSGEAGFVARSGPIPIGYYKDEKKTAETFRTIGGERWSIPGDWCTVRPRIGTLNLLGRGSVCINTGGEKVYPEEIEESLKQHPAVYDAAVVGLPDERWGEAVTALVELRAGSAPTQEELRAHVRERLAPYKAPKSVLFVDSIGRAPSGKVDYKALKARAREALGVA